MSYLKIIEQPQNRVRFRYNSEKRSMGSIHGVSNADRVGGKEKTYPTIELIDHNGPAWLVISCVTRDRPHYPHPHEVTQGGGDLKNGICHFEIPEKEPRIVIKNLSIQCTRRKDIVEALEKREKLRVDPFKTGFKHRDDPDSIDLTSVRLCFQVFIEGKTPGSFNVPLRPVVSEPIYDKKQAGDLNIVFMSHASGSAAGGTEMCILAEKVSKDEEVRFYDSKGWEVCAKTVTPHHHKQMAVVFRTPPYKTHDLDVPVTVKVQLIRSLDDQKSMPIEFQYRPLNPDEMGAVPKKRHRVHESPRALMDRHLKADRERDAMFNNLSKEKRNMNQEKLLQYQQPDKNQISQPPQQHQLQYDNPMHIEQQIDELIQQMREKNQQELLQQKQQQQQQQWYQQQQGINPMADPVLQRQMQIIEQQHKGKFRSTVQSNF